MGRMKIKAIVDQFFEVSPALKNLRSGPHLPTPSDPAVAEAVQASRDARGRWKERNFLLHYGTNPAKFDSPHIELEPEPQPLPLIFDCMDCKFKSTSMTDAQRHMIDTLGVEAKYKPLDQQAGHSIDTRFATDEEMAP